MHPAHSWKTKATTATSTRLIHSASGTCLVLKTKTRGRTSHHCSFSTSLILHHPSYFFSSFFLLFPSTFLSFTSSFCYLLPSRSSSCSIIFFISLILSWSLPHLPSPLLHVDVLSHPCVVSNVSSVSLFIFFGCTRLLSRPLGCCEWRITFSFCLISVVLFCDE